MSKTSGSILVVEDDLDIGTMIKIMLEYHGYSVEVTPRAEKTIDLVRGGNFNLVIMDMLLSGANGMDICARLKQDKFTLHTPVIMISAHPNAKEISRNAGAEDFLPKPFDMEEMLAKVRVLVKPKSPG